MRHRPGVQGPRHDRRDRAAAAQDRPEGHVHRARPGQRRGARCAKENWHDPDRQHAARRQPRRGPRGAGQRHARLPASCWSTAPARASRAAATTCARCFAPLRADPPRPGARERARSPRGAQNLRRLVHSLRELNGELAEQGRASSPGWSTRRPPCSARSPPRRPNVSRAVARAAGRAAPDDRRRWARWSLRQRAAAGGRQAAAGRARARRRQRRR